MVKVRFSADLMRMEMDGHAGGERVNGIDEVCAASSILAYTMAQTAERCKHLQMAAHVTADLTPGHALVEITPQEGSVEAIQEKVQVILTGFALLAEYRPECIQMTTE